MGVSISSDPGEGVLASGLLLGPLLSGAATIQMLPQLDLLLPVTGLLLSLVLQIVMLITGQLRRRQPAAKLPAWMAYVGADLVAVYTLGLLSKANQHVGLYGLWAALLVYHLGGPDTLTAFERADSELWKRHAVNLLIQVASALHVIYIDSRGWILVPTLLVFSVGFVRYWERNLALKRSSGAGITEGMTALYKYMENEGQPGPPGKLNYIVAGASHWYSTMKRLAGPTGRFSVLQSYQESRPDLVTTADIELELSLPAEVAPWAQWLVVASASSSAYLRRVIGLARLEQYTEGATQLRKLWFGEKLAVEDWMPYVQIEQDFLYNLLYTKPTDPDGNFYRFLFRILSSKALLMAMLGMFFLAGNDDFQEYKLFQIVTYIVLLVGAVIELGYVVRLFFSKGAVVAMLVHLVKAQRAKKKPTNAFELSLGPIYSVEQLACVWVLKVNKWWELTMVTHNKTYAPGSEWEKGWKTQRSFLNKVVAYVPALFMKERSWEMVRMAVPADRDCTALLNSIDEHQSDAVMTVLESIRNLTALPPDKSRAAMGMPTGPVPLWLPYWDPSSRHRAITSICQRSFYDFYASDWEHVLLIWWIATLKVLSIQERSLMIHFPVDQQYQRADVLRVAQARLSTLENPRLQARASSRIEPGPELEGLLAETSRNVEPGTEYENLLAEISIRSELGPEDEDLLAEASCEVEPGPEYEALVAKPNIDSESGPEDEGLLADAAVPAKADATRMEALWLMVYICRLFTVSPELLPTHLELTKRLVAENLAIAQKDICDPSDWVRNCSYGTGKVISTSDVHDSSSQLAMKLMTDFDGEERWEVVKRSASHFIAALAQNNKVVEHCSKLTQGGELLTTLWILSSHLGGGVQ